MVDGQRRELLIGCGSRRDKIIHAGGFERWGSLTTLDFMERNKPDVLWDLETLPYPFPADEFDEIHAYEVLEHIGDQGDWKTFFG